MVRSHAFQAPNAQELLAEDFRRPRAWPGGEASPNSVEADTLSGEILYSKSAQTTYSMTSPKADGVVARQQVRQARTVSCPIVGRGVIVP